MKRMLIASGVLAVLPGAGVVTGQATTPATTPDEDPVAPCAAMMGDQGVTAEGRAEMKRFLESGKMTQAMTGMMGMARNMGDGDPMKGMVRMMEMTGSMNGMMGSGMMGPSTPNDQTPRCGEDRELNGGKDGDGNDGEVLPDLPQGSDRPHVQALRRVDLLGGPR